MNHNDFYLYIESSVGEQEKMMNWNLEVLTEREKKHFHNRIIKQFAQRGCRNSILGGFQDLPGESAKQSGLNSNVDPALSRKPGWKTSQSSFQNEWLGDSKASEAIKMLRRQSKCFSCFLCPTPADTIPASLSVCKMRSKYCDQVVFSHPHCFMVYHHPENIITTMMLRLQIKR